MTVDDLLNDLHAIPVPMRDGKLDRGAWLELRKPFFNASDAPALYDCHPFKSAADVAVSKLVGDTFDGNDSTRRGNYLEPALLNWLSDELGIAITEPTHLYVCDGVMQTPDGEFVGTDARQPEAKTSNQWGAGDPFPPYWRCQATAQCVARPSLEAVDFVILDRWLRLSHVEIVPSEAEKADLRHRASRFMGFIAFGMVPEDCVLEYPHVLSLFPPAEPETAVDVDDDGLDLLRAWDELRQARLLAEAAEKDARDAVARLFLGASVARYGSADVASWRTQKDGKRVLRPLKALWTPEVGRHPLDRFCGRCGHAARKHNSWWDDLTGAACGSGMGCDECDCDDIREPTEAMA